MVEQGIVHGIPRRSGTATATATATATGLVALLAAWMTATAQEPWATVDDWQFSASADMAEAFAVAGTADASYVGGYAMDAGDTQWRWIIRRSVDGGASWTTDDDIPPNPNARVNGLAVGGDGAVYAAGLSGNHWIVRRLGTAGWQTVDDFAPTVRNQASMGIANGVSVNSTGSIFAVGRATPNIWYVRRSVDGGASWTTVDAFQAVNGLGAEARAVAVDSSDRIFVTGYAYTSKPKGKTPGSSSSFTRVSANGGDSWTTTDSSVIVPMSIAADSSGAVYVAGFAGNPRRWVVRKSPTGTPGTWFNVDDFQLAPGLEAQAGGVVVDGVGSVRVAGYAAGDFGERWIVRKSVDGGATWTGSDDFQHVPGLPSAAWCIGRTPVGVMAVGAGFVAGDQGVWVVRMLSE